MGTIDISYLSLGIGLLLLSIPLFYIWKFKTGLLRATLIGTARMIVQLFFIGIYLKYLFLWNNPWINFLWVIVMILVASQTALARTQLKRKILLIPISVGFLCSVVCVGMYFIGIVLRLENVFSAQYFIPIFGILMGNMLSSNVIALNTYYSGLKREQQLYRYLLGNGATRTEAQAPFIRQAIIKAFSPLIANISVMGLVAIRTGSPEPVSPPEAAPPPQPVRVPSIRMARTAACSRFRMFISSASSLFEIALQRAQRQIADNGQQGDQDAARRRHGRIVNGDSPVDGHAQATGPHKGGNASHGDGHDHHVPHARQDDSGGHGQLHPKQRLCPRTAHAPGCLQNIRVQCGESHVGVVHHGHDAVNRQGNNGSLVADPAEGDQDAQQGDGGNGVQHVADAHHRRRDTGMLRDPDACQKTDHAGHGDGGQSQADVGLQQSREPVCPLGVQAQNPLQQFHEPLTGAGGALRLPDRPPRSGRTGGSAPS